MMSIECVQDFFINQAGAENVFESWNSYTFKTGRCNYFRTINKHVHNSSRFCSRYIKLVVNSVVAKEIRQFSREYSYLNECS